jgi:hypothetical protein
MDTYEALIKYFYLRTRQIEMLDACSERESILAAMGGGDIIKARDLLIQAEIIFF